MLRVRGGRLFLDLIASGGIAHKSLSLSDSSSRSGTAVPMRVAEAELAEGMLESGVGKYALDAGALGIMVPSIAFSSITRVKNARSSLLRVGSDGLESSITVCSTGGNGGGGGIRVEVHGEPSGLAS